MTAGLNATELSDFAPAWVPEPNGRGLSANLQQKEVVQRVEFTSFYGHGKSFTAVASRSPYAL